MAKRGRKSLDDLTYVPREASQRERISPRADAPAEVASLFREIVASVDSSHWRPADAHLVEQYAQSLLLARQAYQMLAIEGPVVGARANPWNVVLEKAHRSSVALSMRLRLAPQSRIDPKTVGRASRTAGVPKPWEARSR